MGSWKRQKKSNWAKPPWLTRELKPNRILFPYHLSSIHPSFLPSRLCCTGGYWFTVCLPAFLFPQSLEISPVWGVQETCSPYWHWNYHKAQAQAYWFQTTLKRWVLASRLVLLQLLLLSSLSLSLFRTLSSHTTTQPAICWQVQMQYLKDCVGSGVISEILLGYISQWSK
jgi:hypothetical protein